MIKFFLISLLFLVPVFAKKTSASKPVLNCASSHVSSVSINELYNGGGSHGNLEIIEIYFNETTNITDWKLYFHDRNSDVDIVLGIGEGSVTYPDGSSGVDNVTTYPKGTFIVYDIGGIDPTNGEIFIANTSATLADGDSVLIDYFKYYKTSDETVYDVDSPSECSVLLYPTDANAKDISRLTDGSGDFYQYYPGTNTKITVTEGSSNLEDLPSDSNLSANVSISAEFNQTEAYNGDLVTLTLTVTNAAENSITVTDVNITNTIPSGLMYVSDDGGTLLDPTLPSSPYGETTSAFTWRFINGSNTLSFPTDSTAEINIILKVNGCDNNITNTATLSTKQTNNGITTDNSASINIPYSYIVDDNVNECPNACFTTIQDAVDASKGGDTILVCAGTYNEQVSVGGIWRDSLTIKNHDTSLGDVLVKDSGIVFNIDGSSINNITLESIDINSTSEHGINVSGWLNSLNFKSLNVYANKEAMKVLNSIGSLKIDNSIFASGGTSTSSSSSSFFNFFSGWSSTTTTYDAINLVSDVNGFILNDTNISSTGDGVHATGTINSGMNISNTIFFSGGDGIEFNTINDGIKLSNVTINSEVLGINGLNTISGLVEFSDLNITSKDDSIQFQTINNGIIISSSDFNSTSGKGIEFNKDAPNDLNISDVFIISYDSGLYFAEKSSWSVGSIRTNPIIDDSTIISKNSDAIYTKSYDWTDFILKNSCVKTEKSSSFSGSYYGLKLDISNINSSSTINNNCFYAPTANKLAYAKATQSGGKFSGNYWDGHSGNYTHNNVNDNMPLDECPNSCAYNGGGDNNETNTTTTSYKFTAWDDSHSISNRKISTKIDSKDFILTIASLDENGTDYLDFNGSVCVSIKAQNGTTLKDTKLTFTGDTSKNWENINIDKSDKNSSVYIEWKKDDYGYSCFLGGEDNSTTDVDNFAIRPKFFSITAPLTQIYAGENFNLKFYAKDENGVDVQEYDENNSSFEISWDKNSLCNVGTLNISNFSFVDGKNEGVDANYSNLSGSNDFNITINERSGNEYALIDASDTNASDRYIASYTKFIDNIKPYEINVTVADMNASTGVDWLYMANVNDMNLSLFGEVKAFNKQGVLLEDFNSSCYAIDTDVNFAVDSENTPNIDINYSIAINDIFGSVTSSDIADINKTITTTASSFTGGEANVSYVLNVDRKSDLLVKPFSIKDLNISISTMGIAKYINPNSDNSNITFYYGRVVAKDIQTSDDNVSHFAEFEVYDPDGNYASGFKQNTLNWYRNENHNDAKYGDVNITSNESDIHISNYAYADGKKTFDIENSTTPLTNGTYKMDINASSWLLYKPYGLEPYFNYTFKGSSSFIGIKSGVFNGSDIDIKPRGEYDRTGVKVFR